MYIITCVTEAGSVWARTCETEEQARQNIRKDIDDNIEAPKEIIDKGYYIIARYADSDSVIYNIRAITRVEIENAFNEGDWIALHWVEGLTPLFLLSFG